MSNHRSKHILVVRADNMGDVLMSGPAIRALKISFGARITLLTSRLGSNIAPFMPGIDGVVIADLPWVRTDAVFSPDTYGQLVEQLRSLRVDLAVIFTVYSQSALPVALLCWQAGITARLAYCRENPYQLLTDWVPDEEPYSFIRHQVQRDLDLVKHIGADAPDDRLQLTTSLAARGRMHGIVAGMGIDVDSNWLVLHPGVSETKREYPLSQWIETAKLLRRETGLPLLVTGGLKEQALAGAICEGAGDGAYVLAGKLDMEEFIALIGDSPLVISVNTVTVHIAAAVGTPLVVLYALTNPQHTPWRVRSEILPFSVDPENRSRNEIVRYVSEHWGEGMPLPGPERILEAVRELLQEQINEVKKYS